MDVRAVSLEFAPEAPFEPHVVWRLLPVTAEPARSWSAADAKMRAAWMSKQGAAALIEVEDHEGRFLLAWDGRILEWHSASGQDTGRFHVRFITAMEVSQDRRGFHLLRVHLRHGYKSSRSFVVAPQQEAALRQLVQAVEQAAGLR